MSIGARPARARLAGYGINSPDERDEPLMGLVAAAEVTGKRALLHGNPADESAGDRDGQDGN
jgi:hypothetical protein